MGINSSNIKENFTGQIFIVIVYNLDNEVTIWGNVILSFQLYLKKFYMDQGYSQIFDRIYLLCVSVAQ